MLLQHPQVQEGIVVVREDKPGEKRLVAYVVLSQPLTAAAMVLRDFLQQQLPHYLIPSIFMVLEALPLTPNGKVDRRALPEPDLSLMGLGDNFAPPQTPTEKLLATIWTDVLRLVLQRDFHFLDYN